MYAHYQIYIFDSIYKVFVFSLASKMFNMTFFVKRHISFISLGKRPNP